MIRKNQLKPHPPHLQKQPVIRKLYKIPQLQIIIRQVIPYEGQLKMNDQNEMQHQDPNFILDIKVI